MNGVTLLIDEKQVSYLLAIAVNGNLSSSQCRNDEMGDPPLIFVAELPRPVNAAHAEHDRRQIIDAGVVPHILVCGTL